MLKSVSPEMWRYLVILFVLINLCQASNDCLIPTEDNEVSVCSYCSDSHAGVRWAVHPSTLNKYPRGPYVLDIRFRCYNAQNMIGDITEDACFYGLNMPILTSLHEPSVWRWHILGEKLPEGTVCQFTANVKNGFYRNIAQLSTSCTINSGNESMVMPATCSESNNSLSCPCQCSEGFRANQEVVKSLTCKNIDECSEGIHSCINVSDCVDMDGSYYCINDTTLPPPTTLGMPTTTEIFSTTASATETMVTPTATTVNTISSPELMVTPTVTTVNTISSPEVMITPSATTVNTISSPEAMITPSATTVNTISSLTSTATDGTVITISFTTHPSSSSGNTMSKPLQWIEILAVLVTFVLAILIIFISCLLFITKRYFNNIIKGSIYDPNEPFDTKFAPVEIVSKSLPHSFSAVSITTKLDPLINGCTDPEKVNFEQLDSILDPPGESADVFSATQPSSDPSEDEDMDVHMQTFEPSNMQNSIQPNLEYYIMHHTDTPRVGNSIAWDQDEMSIFHLDSGSEDSNGQTEVMDDHNNIITGRWLSEASMPIDILRPEAPRFNSDIHSGRLSNGYVHVGTYSGQQEGLRVADEELNYDRESSVIQLDDMDPAEQRLMNSNGYILYEANDQLEHIDGSVVSR